jgi:tetratricopeptide (TPR) repeat protein
VTLTAADLIKRAAALREAQQMEEALEAIMQAVQRDASDPRAAFGLAQISFETWRPAATLFATARKLSPANPDLIRNHALALAAEGDDFAAISVLEEALAKQPGWIDGHRTLASLHTSRGDRLAADKCYSDACRSEPSDQARWMVWFHYHALSRNWDEARRILNDAEAKIGPKRAFDLAAIFLACESGTAVDDDHLFDAYEAMGDPGLDLCHVRHCLRLGRVPQAEIVAARHIGKSSARMFWPYLSLCWRLQDDARAQWLDGDPLYARTFDLDFSDSELSTLAAFLRGLHRMKAPYPEQSVRGGTQTDRQLFFHHDPLIQRVRAKIGSGVATYVAGLSAPDPNHPLLSFDRNQNLFEGSWSVRLAAGGFHSSHTHVKGWISSAFYVALPGEEERGSAPAGWLALGTPPPELNLDLSPTALFEPKVGRLLLFPSTQWHSTIPFDAGERLSIAFDVRAGQ